jgi:hypothetical protein
VEHVGTTNDDRASQDWFEIEGRPLDVRELRGASGQACRMPLGPRFDATLARWADQPAGIVLAHACALSAVAIVDRLSSTWPHREFAGNAERDWRDVLSLTCALRHVHRVHQRSRDSERRMRAMQRDGWRIGEDHEALQPLVDLDAFEACGMPCCPLPSTVGAPEPFGDDQLRATLASHHHAVAAVAGDVLWILELSLAHAGALRPREDWRDAVARCGTRGPNLLRAAWQASANAVALGADAPMPGGCCYRRPAVWPADYWPAWRGIENLLSAEMARACAGGTAAHRPPATEARPEANAVLRILRAIDGDGEGVLDTWQKIADATDLSCSRVSHVGAGMITDGLIARTIGGRRCEPFRVLEVGRRILDRR